MSLANAADITIDSATNFKENITSANSGDTIILKSGMEYSLNSANVDITIDKNIKIKSSNPSKNAVINLNRHGRLFYVLHGDKSRDVKEGRLTLINITIKNSKDGAINNGGTLILTGCTFINNKAGGGAAVYNDGGKATLTGCTFTNNIATSKLEGGGAIYNAGRLTLIACTFTNNKANCHGGAIYNAFTTQTVTITAKDCTFINNKATGDGGAISGWGSFTTCTFINNKAGAGGAIANLEKAVILKGCTFSNNQARIYGGAIYSDKYNPYGCRLDIVRTTFKNNIVTRKNIYNAIYTIGTKVSKSGVKIIPRDGTRIKEPDLTITKVTKKGNYRYVFVKNIGNSGAGKNTLGVYIGNTLIKTVTVNAIATGKTLRVTVSIPKKYATKAYNNQFKTFKVDIRNVVREINENNNSFKAK